MASTTYVIQDGDTLSGIAQAACGDASLFPALAALNSIPNPDVIYVGDTLVIDCEAMQVWASGAAGNPPPALPLPPNPDPTNPAPPDMSSLPPNIPPLSSITGGGAGGTPTTD